MSRIVHNVAEAERLAYLMALPVRRSGLAEQVVGQVHDAIGSMYPVSSVGREEADEIVRKAVATTLTRLIGTGLGVGTCRQVDTRLRDLARQVMDSPQKTGTEQH